MNGPADVFVEGEGRIERVPDRLFEGKEPVLHVIERGQHRSAFVTLDSSDTRFGACQAHTFREGSNLTGSQRVTREPALFPPQLVSGLLFAHANALCVPHRIC